MQLKELFLKAKKRYTQLSKPSKISLGIGAFFIGGNLISSVYSGIRSMIYDISHFDSMHSGKDSSMSSYSNMNMTDFGSGWRGLSSNILELIGKKNNGLSEVMKLMLTPFNNNGINLGKTMIKQTKKPAFRKHINRTNIRDNIVFDLHKNRINHMIIN